MMTGRPQEDLCIFVQERLEMFLDGELTGSENLSFLTHLKECEHCAEHWAADEAVCEAVMVTLARHPDQFATTPPASGDQVGPSPYSRRASDVVLVERRTALIPVFAAAAAALVLGFAFGHFGGRRDVGPNEVVEQKRHRITLASGRPLVKTADESVWARAARGMDIEPGTAFRLKGDDQVVMSIASGGSVSLASGASARFAGLGDAGEDVEIDLATGQLAVDLRDASFVVRTDDGELEGWSAAFSILVAEDGASRRLLVGRGEVRVRTGSTLQTIKAGRLVRFVHGDLLDEVDARALEGAVAVAEEDSAIVAQALEQARIENDGLRLELERLQRRLEGLESGIAQLNTPEDILADYLDKVDRTNFVRVSQPNEFLKDAVDALRPFGATVATLLDEALVSEVTSLRRKAIVGLLGHLGFNECVEPLKHACFDDSRMVHEAAIIMLARWQTGELVDHYVVLMNTHTQRPMRLMAAQSAAMLGSDGGFQKLVEEFYAVEGVWRRSVVLKLILKIDQSRLVAPFLRNIVRDVSSSDQLLAPAIQRLGTLGDRAALPLLQDLVEGQGVSREVRRLAYQALEAIQP